MTRRISFRAFYRLDTQTRLNRFLCPKELISRKILLIGSGPIVIGQACEFDYSGTQACKALKDEGYEVGPDQFQSGHHHDRPGIRGPDLYRTGAARIRGGHNRTGTPGRAPAHPGRPDRAEHGRGRGRTRRSGTLRRGTDRRQPGRPSKRPRTGSFFARP